MSVHNSSIVISPPDLYNVLSSSPRVVVFDIRKKTDFVRERIWSSIHLDLESYPTVHDIAKKLFSTTKNSLNEENSPITPHTLYKLFVNRELYHIVVVDDDGSSHSFVSQLIHKRTFNPTQLLAGGYKMFSTLYPDLCQGTTGQDLYLMAKCEKAWRESHPFQILPHLYCGGSNTAQNYRALDTLGIGSLVNAAVNVENHAPACYKYIRCDQEELPHGDLAPLFDGVFTFIERARRDNDNVLIYSAGNDDGRAGMFACAYLMRLNDWSLESAFLYFKKHMPFSPNVAILARLGEYETSLVGTKHVEEAMHHDVSEDDFKTKKHNAKLSEELKYVRRQQIYQLEDEIAERKAIAADEIEEDLC